MRKPTLLFLVSHAKTSGPGAVALQHAVLLRETGCRVLFCCHTGGSLRAAAEMAGIWFEHPLKLSTRGQIFSLFMDGIRLRKLAPREKVDVIFCYRSTEHLVAGYALGGRIPLVRFVQSKQKSPPTMPKISGAWLLKKSWTTHLLTPNPHALSGIFKCLGIHPDCATAATASPRRLSTVAIARKLLLENERVSWVPGGVDTLRFTPDRGGTSIRHELGLTDEAIVVGIVARMKPERGLDIAMSAFIQAAREVTELRLLLIGDGEEKEKLQAQATSAGVANRVAFFTPGSRFLEALAAIDIGMLLHPGSAGTARAALELMSMARPLVLGQGGGNVLDFLDGTTPDTATEVETGGEVSGVAAIRLPARDGEVTVGESAERTTEEMALPEGLGKALVVLAQDADLRFSIGLAARELMEKTYSRKVLQKQLLRLCEQIMTKEDCLGVGTKTP